MLLSYTSTFLCVYYVAFFKTTTITSQGENDDLLVYYVSLPISTPAPIPVKPPITQV